VNRAGEGFLRALRVRLFGHIQQQPLAFHDRNKSGVLVSRMTADIESMAELVQWGLLQFVSAILLVDAVARVLSLLSWQLTIVALLVLPIIIVASRKFQRDSNRAYLDVRERVGQNLSACRRASPGSGSSRHTVVSRSSGAASARRTGRSTTRTSTASRCRPGTSGSSSSAASSPRRSRSARRLARRRGDV
jgi:ABC-type multidrug transport system fused ATPase/permease subunit